MPHKCKEDRKNYIKNYQRNWLRSRRKAWVDENGPCNYCGANKDLEIDHIDPKQKEYKISAIWSLSQSTLKKELAKCQVLCKNCHLEKTKKEHWKKK